MLIQVGSTYADGTASMLSSIAARLLCADLIDSKRGAFLAAGSFSEAACAPLRFLELDVERLYVWAGGKAGKWSGMYGSFAPPSPTSELLAVVASCGVATGKSGTSNGKGWYHLEVFSNVGFLTSSNANARNSFQLVCFGRW